MALHQARFAGCLPPCIGDGLLEDRVWAPEDYGAPLSANDGGYRYDRAVGMPSAAQSELMMCNGRAAAVPSRKRGRETSWCRTYQRFSCWSRECTRPGSGRRHAAATSSGREPDGGVCDGVDKRTGRDVPA